MSPALWGPLTLPPTGRGAQALATRTWGRPAWRAATSPGLALAGLVGGLGARLAGAARLGDLLLSLTVAVGLVPLAGSVARALWRREPGVDLIALLAMAGALALGEVLAGAVIAVMLASGRLLEAYAAGRARREAARPAGAGPAGGAPLPGRQAGFAAAGGGPPR
jgi:cation transport ATPase